MSLDIEEKKARKRERDKAYRLANREKLVKGMRERYQRSKQEYAEKGSIYRKENRSIIAERRREYYLANKVKHAASSTAWYKANKAKVAAQRRADYQANRDEKLAFGREYYKLNKKKVAERSREKVARRYGLDRVLYDELISSSGFRCNVCQTDKPGGPNHKFNIDHCHQTGKIRGVLCTGCNTAIGRLGDTIEGLMRAVEYLKNPPMAEAIKRIFEDGLLV